jgi:hypothetical protein
MNTPGIKARSKLCGVPGGESTYISTPAEGETRRMDRRRFEGADRHGVIEGSGGGDYQAYPNGGQPNPGPQLAPHRDMNAERQSKGAEQQRAGITHVEHCL